MQPFPGLGQKWQVSIGGGAYPRWKRDGKEIFFLKLPEKTLMAAEVKPGPTFEVGEPRALFQTQIKSADFGTQYDVSPDGSRFLINTLVDEGKSERAHGRAELDSGIEEVDDARLWLLLWYLRW